MRRAPPTLLICWIAAATAHAGEREPTNEPAEEARDGSGDEAPDGENEGEPKTPYERHMRNGVKLFREKDWDGAIAEFEAAYRAEPKASPLINLALTYKKLNDPARAVKVLEKALEQHRDSMPPDQIEAAEREAEEMRALIAYVPVSVKPAEAQLFVDGRPIDPERLEQPLALSPGTRVFRARAEGYRDAERRVRVVSGRGNAPVSMVLEPTLGEVFVTAQDEDAWIEIDGERRAQGTWRGALPPGLHVVRVTEGDEVERVDVVVRAGATLDVIQNEDGELVSDAAIPEEDRERAFGPKVPELLHGVYLMGGGALLTATPVGTGDDRRFQPEDADRFGGAVSLHAGYRVADWAGFEAFGQFSDIRVGGSVTTTTFDPSSDTFVDRQTRDVTMVLTSVRFGGLMRIILPGRNLIRFVATLGGGGAYEILKFQQEDGVTLAPPFVEKETGVGFLAQLDLGMEIEYENVLFDLLLQHTLQTTKHFDLDEHGGDNAFETQPMLVAGPVLRIGYGLW